MFGWNKSSIMVMLADSEDLPEIAALHAASFSRGWSQEELMGLMDQETMLFLVARKVGTGKPSSNNSRSPVIGFNIIRRTEIEAEIISVAVAPRWRRYQVGDALMRDAINRLAADRVLALFLEVDEANTPALGLYKKLGFQTVGTRPGYYSNKGQSASGDKPANSSALVMRLELG